MERLTCGEGWSKPATLVFSFDAVEQCSQARCALGANGRFHLPPVQMAPVNNEWSPPAMQGMYLGIGESWLFMFFKTSGTVNDCSLKSSSMPIWLTNFHIFYIVPPLPNASIGIDFNLEMASPFQHPKKQRLGNAIAKKSRGYLIPHRK